MTFRLILMFAIVALNAFFAAAEVSLVSSRPSRLKALAHKGNAAAQIALNLLANPERLLSVVQVGVTAASLGLGWAGEDTVFQLLLAVAGRFINPETEIYWHGAAFAIAFISISFIHVVLGEVVPKNLAIEKAERLALLMAPPLMVFYRISEPFVWIIERSAAGISRAIGLKGETHGGGHSAEELKFIVASSRREGHLEGFEEVTIQKLLDLSEVYTREIMVPRIDIVSVPVNSDLDDLLRLALDLQYSRLPVYEETPEHIIGIIHYKDLLQAWQERKLAIDRRSTPRPFRLRRFVRKALVVPETKPVSQLIDEFRKARSHMALVVDEFGTITGLVTIEDALEQIFGEIEDEHDILRAPPAMGAAAIEVDGATNIRDLAALYGIELPGDAGFETLAGFILFQLGYIPKAGESMSWGDRNFTVTEMDRNRITRVRIDEVRPPGTSAQAS